MLGTARGLQDALATGLGLDSHDAHERCAKWVAESPRIAEKREKFLARQKRLLGAQDELFDVFACILILVFDWFVRCVLANIMVPIGGKCSGQSGDANWQVRGTNFDEMTLQIPQPTRSNDEL